jgi:integrase
VTVQVGAYRERRLDTLWPEAKPADCGEMLAARPWRRSSFPVECVRNRTLRWSRGGLKIIRLLLLTGARLGEIITLEQSAVDFERGSARLADSKTGPKTLRLGAAALDVIARAPRTGKLVFPDGKGRPLYRSRIERVWWSIRDRAGIPDVRLHDLRHTYASWGAMGGASMPMLGALLGHRAVNTTARYAHLRDDPVHQVAETISATLAAALAGNSGDVVDLPRRRGK